MGGCLSVTLTVTFTLVIRVREWYLEMSDKSYGYSYGYSNGYISVTGYALANGTSRCPIRATVTVTVTVTVTLVLRV